MKTKTDEAFGIVPLYKNGDEFEVLVLHQISHRGDRFWIFPKGHAEGDEQPVEAALRELEEETGVTDIVLDTKQDFVMQYSFKHEDALIKKTVTYYLGYASNKETKITQPQEVVEIRWCSLDAAAELLTHKNTKNILKDVKKYLKS